MKFPMILSPEQLKLAGARVLMRVDFNVPLHKETLEPTDLTRIRAALPTIEYVLNAGASVVLSSHLGRPKGGPEDKYSLRHIVPALESVLNRKVRFVTDCISQEALEASADLQPGSVLLLENVRFYPVRKPVIWNLPQPLPVMEIVTSTMPSELHIGNMPQRPL